MRAALEMRIKRPRALKSSANMQLMKSKSKIGCFRRLKIPLVEVLNALINRGDLLPLLNARL